MRTVVNAMRCISHAGGLRRFLSEPFGPGSDPDDE